MLENILAQLFLMLPTLSSNPLTNFSLTSLSPCSVFCLSLWNLQVHPWPCPAPVLVKHPTTYHNFPHAEGWRFGMVHAGTGLHGQNPKSSGLVPKKLELTTSSHALCVPGEWGRDFKMGSYLFVPYEVFESMQSQQSIRNSLRRQQRNLGSRSYWNSSLHLSGNLLVTPPLSSTQSFLLGLNPGAVDHIEYLQLRKRTSKDISSRCCKISLSSHLPQPGPIQSCSSPNLMASQGSALTSRNKRTMFNA